MVRIEFKKSGAFPGVRGRERGGKSRRNNGASWRKIKVKELWRVLHCQLNGAN